MLIYDVLNEKPFLCPEMRPILLDEKNINPERELLKLISTFGRDVNSDRKIPHRLNRSSENLATVVERRVS